MMKYREGRGDEKGEKKLKEKESVVQRETWRSSEEGRVRGLRMEVWKWGRTKGWKKAWEEEREGIISPL